jgi:hypothetical protein
VQQQQQAVKVFSLAENVYNAWTHRHTIARHILQRFVDLGGIQVIDHHACTASQCRWRQIGMIIQAKQTGPVTQMKVGHIIYRQNDSLLSPLATLSTACFGKQWQEYMQVLPKGMTLPPAIVRVVWLR